MIFIIGILIIIIFLMIAIFMFTGYRKSNNIYHNEVFIVIGTSIKDDNCYYLDARLDQLAQILNSSPKTICILSKGINNSDSFSIVHYMKDYLVRKHLIRNRIFTEDYSSNIKESIKFSCEIIERKKLNKEVVVDIEKFKQFRAQKYCVKYGLYPVGVFYKHISSNYVFSCFKEVLEIIKMFFTNFISEK